MPAARPRPQAEIKVERPPRRPGAFLLALLGLALVAGGVRLVQIVSDPTALPIRRVKVEGDFRHLAPAQVEALVSGAVRGGFFSIDVQTVRARIMAEPWVAEATVRRVWPDGIRVALVEQRPVARWGERALLNADAVVFAPDPASLPQGLPALSGPPGSEAEVLATFRSATARLAPLGLTVAGVHLSDRRAWSLELADGAELVIGRHDVEARIARFGEAYAAVLEPHWERIAAVDLRYTNGFAIRERVPEPDRAATALSQANRE